jgi:hypothetical protein
MCYECDVAVGLVFASCLCLQKLLIEIMATKVDRFFLAQCTKNNTSNKIYQSATKLQNGLEIYQMAV